MSATPETDALYAQMLAENPGNFIHLEEFLKLACRLERERDEAMKQNATLREIAEGAIMCASLWAGSRSSTPRKLRDQLNQIK